MKKYNITVNGNTYEVEVEEVGGAPGAASAAAASPAAAPAAPVVSASAGGASPTPTTAPVPSAPSAGAAVVTSPMPGTILDVLKKPGDAVGDGEVVLILEAMKMENEIVAPSAGVIDAVVVAKGASVNAEDTLFSIK